MNRSYSKLRHIQDLNKRLDNRLVEEKSLNLFLESFNDKTEKDNLIDILEKQRILEEKLKFGRNNLLIEQDEDVEQDEDLSGMPSLETEEDYDAIIKYYPEEFQEFLDLFVKKVESSPEANQSDTLSESTINDSEIITLLESCKVGYGNFYLADCFKNKKRFKNWMKKTGYKIDNLGEKIKKAFRKWVKKTKGIDLDIEFKKFKKRKNKYKRKNSRKLKRLEKTWIGKKPGSAIKIGRARWVTFGKSKDAASAEFNSDETLEPSIDEEEWQTYLKENEKTMVSLMSNVSKENWEQLKLDQEKIGYAVAVLENFNDTYEEKKWKKVGVGMDRETFIKEVEVDPVISDIPPNEKIYPLVPFQFPLKPTNEPNLFEDNEWDEAHAQVFLSEVKNLCEDVKKAMSGLTPPKDKPKAFLESVYLQASASRLRNQGRAEKLSFKQLSENRLETGKAILIRELTAIGVLVNEKTQFIFDTDANKSELNPYGNGDGSSGPNGILNVNYYIPKGNYPMTPFCDKTVSSCKLYGKEVPRNECGEPYKKKSDYDKHKFINGTVHIIFNDDYETGPIKTPPDDSEENLDPEVTVIETSNYPIYFYAPGKKPFRIPIPGLRIKWKNLFRIRNIGKVTYGPPNKKPGSTKCEFFQ